MFWRTKRKIDNSSCWLQNHVNLRHWNDWDFILGHSVSWQANFPVVCCLQWNRIIMSWKDVTVYSQSHVFSCSVFCSTGTEISYFWFIRTQEKINVKIFFAILTVCIITDCKFYQANEKILSYQLQGQPQKMGYSQIPIKKYAHT